MRITTHAVIVGLLVVLASGMATIGRADDGPLDYRIERSAAADGFDGQTCWVHARAGAIPPGGSGNPGTTPLVVMTMQKLLLTGSDVFYALNSLRTDDPAADAWLPWKELEMPDDPRFANAGAGGCGIRAMENCWWQHYTGMDVCCLARVRAFGRRNTPVCINRSDTPARCPTQ